MSHRGSILCLPSGIYGWDRRRRRIDRETLAQGLRRGRRRSRCCWSAPGGSWCRSRPTLAAALRERGIVADADVDRRGGAHLQRASRRGPGRRGGARRGGLSGRRGPYQRRDRRPPPTAATSSARGDPRPLPRRPVRAGRRRGRISSRSMPSRSKSPASATRSATRRSARSGCKWWEAALRGDHGGSPVAAALAGTIAEFSLPLAAFDNLLEARVFDLYDDPMPTRERPRGLCRRDRRGGDAARRHDPGRRQGPGDRGARGPCRGRRRADRTSCARCPGTPRAGSPSCRRTCWRSTAPTAAHVAARESTPAVRYVARRPPRPGARAAGRGAARCVGGATRRCCPPSCRAALVDAYLDRMERPRLRPAPRPRPTCRRSRRQWTLWRAARKGRL